MKDEDNKNLEKQEGDVESSFNIPQDDSAESSFNTIQDDSAESEVTFVDSTEDGEELPMKDITKKLRDDLKICRKEKEEYLTGWQRAKADYVNLQKELDQVRINSGAFAKENIVSNLLPALDSFEMAFADKNHWEKIDKDWQNGITSIYQQLLSGLSGSGIDKIDTVDVPFDPSIHQSISIIETDKKEKDHTVEKVLQFGYKIGNRIIRPAKVTIYEYKK